MTHYISMYIKVKEWDDVKEIKEIIEKSFNDGDSNIFGYKLVKDKLLPKTPHYHLTGDLCPFIYLPENEKDKDEDYGDYIITIDTGSHCSWNDTEEILFVWTFWTLFKRELDQRMIEHKYWITEDGEDNKWNLADAFEKILEDDEELKKLIIKKR